MKLLNQKELEIAANILKNGGIIAFPTETVFGLGVVYDDEKAYQRLVAVKRRPPEKPFTLMLAETKDIAKYAVIDKKTQQLIDKFMPGQFTIIVDAKPGLPKWCVSNVGKVGIRIADYKVITDIIKMTGKPLLVPSANKSGEPPATTHEEVIKNLGDELDAIVEGKSVSNTPSTVVVIDDKGAHVVRAGAITQEQIDEEISKEL